MGRWDASIGSPSLSTGSLLYSTPGFGLGAERGLKPLVPGHKRFPLSLQERSSWRPASSDLWLPAQGDRSHEAPVRVCGGKTRRGLTALSSDRTSQGSAFSSYFLPLYVTCTAPSPLGVQDLAGLCPHCWQGCVRVNIESVLGEQGGCNITCSTLCPGAPSPFP